MTVAEKLYTVKEFMALPDDGKRYELVEGKLVEMLDPSQKHGEVIITLGSILRDYVRPQKLGKVFGGTAFVFDPVNRPNNARVPDVAFVTVEKLVGTDEYDAIEFAPDLAVEVISPSDEWYKILENVREYLAAGVRLVWLISPPDQTVLVFRHPSIVHETFGGDSELSGDNVLPGFRVKVNQIFDTYA